MNVLLIGSGAREHALAWKLASSPLLERLYCAPGNPGIAQEAQCVALDPADHAAVAGFCRRERIDLVVVGPEQPLVAGLVDDLEAAGIKAFGPSKAAARLEGSKGFTKDLCRRYAIPTADYARFSERDQALAHVRARGAPIVVKADGLMAGKGVVVAQTLAEAESAVEALLAGGGELVIEECLVGREASFFALCDGKDAIPLATAQDYKRAYDGDLGPNTGGMGAVSPAPALTPALVERTMAEIIRPTLAAMAENACPFKGILYAGLMLTAAGPKLIEYNVRFGDPECQVLMLRLRSDLLPALVAACDGVLSKFDLRWHPEPAMTVVMASKGYPGPTVRGTAIRGLETAAGGDENVVIFQAGTAIEDGRLVAAGGRVLSVTATANSLAEARAKAYSAVDRIDWPEGFCRRDIGLEPAP